MQGDGLLGSTLASCRNCARGNSIKAVDCWFRGRFGLIRGDFHPNLSALLANMIRTFAFASVWVWGWLGILFSIAQQLWSGF